MVHRGYSPKAPVARAPASDLYSIASGDTVRAGRRANSSHSQGREQLATPEAKVLHAIIPVPAYLKAGTGNFDMRAAGSIVMQQQDSLHRGIANLLAQSIKALSGKDIPVVSNSGKQNIIIFRLLNTDSSLGTEGYRLTITTRQIILEAAQPAGWFYAVQTLLQLLPSNATAREALSSKATASKSLQGKAAYTQPLRIAAITIHDRPRFGWRGLMLDVSRHFFSERGDQKLSRSDGEIQVQYISLAPDR